LLHRKGKKRATSGEELSIRIASTEYWRRIRSRLAGNA
jgi:hypothetical protein